MQHLLYDLYQEIFVFGQLSIMFIRQLPIIQLLVKKDLQAPLVGIGFIEVKIDTSDIWCLEEINADAMCANKPNRSRDLMNSSPFGAQDVLRVR